MFLNKRGISILGIFILIFIIGAIGIYALKIYNHYITGNLKNLIQANVETIEDEVKSRLIDSHPVLIWNNINEVIESTKMQNPISKERQVKNGYGIPGAVVVNFDGVNTFTIDGIGPDGEFLNINIIIKHE